MKDYNLDQILTKDIILSKISEEEIFEKYLGVKPIFGKKYKNPLRVDDHPDCRFYIDNRGVLKFNDIARKGWNWDCFNIVQIIYNVNFGKALEIIAQDFNIYKRKYDENLLNRRKQLQLFNLNKKIEIKVKIRDWRTYDLDYWGQYHLDISDLQVFNIFPLEFAWLDGDRIYKFSKTDLAYCYYFGKEIYKLYFPFREKGEMKHCHNDSTILQGIHLLSLQGDNLIITKSYKDVICLSKFDIQSVAPMSETIIPLELQINDLKNRFKNIFTLYDRDKTGKYMSKLMRDKYNTIPLMFSKQDEKDFSDNLKKYGIQYMNDYIEETKNLLL